MWSCTGYWIDKCLECLLVDMQSLKMMIEYKGKLFSAFAIVPIPHYQG